MLKRFWLAATAALLGTCLATATATAYPPPKPVKPMPAKPVPFKPVAPKHGYHKHLHPSVKKLVVHKHHHFSHHRRHHHHFGCVMYWSPEYRCWFYWHPRFVCYMPVTYIYEYPPVEEMIPSMEPWE